MNEWYALTNDLETQVPPLDAAAMERILRRSRRHRRKGLRLAAVLAAVLLLTACGLTVTHFSQWFWPVAEDWQNPAASESLFAAMGQVLNQSVAEDGVTLTLHGALYDGDTLVLALSAPEEVGAVTAENVHLVPSRAQFVENLPEADKQDALAYYEDLLQSGFSLAEVHPSWGRDEPGNGFTVWADLGRRDTVQELELRIETVTLEDHRTAGPFVFSFDLEPKAVWRKLSGSTELTLEGETVTLTDAVLTPFTVQLQLEGMDIDLPSDALRITGLQVDHEQVYHSRVKSCQVEQDDSGAWRCILTSGPGDRILDPNRITGLFINGQLIPLEQMK